MKTLWRTFLSRRITTVQIRHKTWHFDQARGSENPRKERATRNKTFTSIEAPSRLSNYKHVSHHESSENSNSNSLPQKWASALYNLVSTLLLKPTNSNATGRIRRRWKWSPNWGSKLMRKTSKLKRLKCGCKNFSKTNAGNTLTPIKRPFS